MQLKLRNAAEADAKRLLEIYSFYVENTAVTFECETPTLDEFAARIRGISARYPYIVALDGERIVGYTYAGAFKARAAYDYSCEVTVYVDRRCRANGVGKALYTALERLLGEMGFTNLYACVAYPRTEDSYLTRNSADFHRHMGYRTVGRFENCAYKFGCWYDMIWLEKVIADHSRDMARLDLDKRRLPV